VVLFYDLPALHDIIGYYPGETEQGLLLGAVRVICIFPPLRAEIQRTRMAVDCEGRRGRHSGVVDDCAPDGMGRTVCTRFMVYMRARYYEPATGRFLSEDPARDGVNWYLYADGNPVNKVDASGKSAVPVLDELNLIFEFLQYLKSWGFPIPDPIMAAGRLFGVSLMLGMVAGGGLKGAFFIYAALSAGGLTAAATLSLGLALSLCIAIVGLCFALAITEGIDFATDPDLYAQGGSSFRNAP